MRLYGRASAYGGLVKQRSMLSAGRVVGRVYAEGLDVNAEQLRRGMAWVYRQYNKDKSLLAIEGDARRDRRGLWADVRPVPPWKFRAVRRSASAGADAR